MIREIYTYDHEVIWHSLLEKGLTWEKARLEQLLACPWQPLGLVLALQQKVLAPLAQRPPQQAL